MNEDNGKMMLAQDAVAAAQTAFDASHEKFLALDKPRPNVVGMGIGIKWSNGEPTGEPALVVLVTQKVEKELLSRTERVPSKLEDMQTDVLAVGYPVAGGDVPVQVGAHHSLTTRLRPAEGGYSVGHKDITAGTIATCVYDIQPGGRASPPEHGVGIPRTYYILSNNHVLANSNAGRRGDPILQPGPADGGTDPADRIASLSRFVPIHFLPSILPNVVDAAIAEGEFHDLDREIYWIGYVRGWRRKSDIQVGLAVQKTGRTTNYTLGRITVINATVDVDYGDGKVARFRDQIITTSMSAPGDSGSLVTTLDNVAVGLLFAGSDLSTIVNQIENVRRLLRVEVAEEIL